MPLPQCFPRATRILGPQRGRDGKPGIWWALASALTFLGVNKQLNLQTLMIVVIRHVATVDGWMDHRRAAQLVFGVVFGLGVGLLLLWLAFQHREFFMTNRQAFWGVVILGVFVASRAATINHADEFLRINLEGRAMGLGPGNLRKCADRNRRPEAIHS